MSVSAISTNLNASLKIEASYKTTNTETAEAVEQKQAEKVDTVVKTDGFQKSEPRQEVGYGNIAKGLSANQVQELNDQRLNSLKSMVEKLISNQAKAGSGFDLSELNINVNIDISISSTNQTGEAYDIENDPNFGIDAMATKLMDMAIALSGGDSSKADTLMAAVQKGFDQATSAWGDELPQVCQKTLAEVNKRFDYWKTNGSMEGYQYQPAKAEE